MPERCGYCAVDRELLAALVARLDRRMSFDLAVSDRTLYLSLGEETLTGVVDDVARPDET